MLTAGTSFASFATTANVTSAKIDPNDPSKINVTATVSDFDPSNPPAVYLFSMKPYQSDVSGRADYLSAQQASSSMTFTFDMQDGPASNRLYDAFALAVDGGSGSYQLISNRCYITNPEVIAPDQSAPAIYGKKGLMIDPNLIDDALKLNLKQASISITTAQLLGSGITYSFEGQNYSFSAKNVSELDNQISRLSNAGVAVTAILLNGFNGAQPDLYIPGTSVQTSDQALYYGFNVMTERGFNLVKAIASFLANRYSGYNGHGKITNWVIGNEINNQYWNYIGNYDYYLEKRETLQALSREEGLKEKSAACPSPFSRAAAENSSGSIENSDSRVSWEKSKELKAAQARRRNELKKTETEISALEEEDRRIDDDLSREEVFTNLEQVTALSRRKEEIQEQLAVLYDRWEELAE